MIKNSGSLDKFEREELQKEKLNYRPALRIFEGMVQSNFAIYQSRVQRWVNS